MVDMVRLSEPSYDKACWDSMMVIVDNIKIYGTNAYEPSCANEYKDMALTKLATGNFIKIIGYYIFAMLIQLQLQLLIIFWHITLIFQTAILENCKVLFKKKI